jgi:CAAX prenyl protease-like protein
MALASAAVHPDCMILDEPVLLFDTERKIAGRAASRTIVEAFLRVHLDDGRRATLAFVVPFVTFVLAMAVDRAIKVSPGWLYPLRFLLVSLAIWIFSRRYISLRPGYPLASAGIGILVFVIWIAPDLLFGYRAHWLFRNVFVGSAVSTASPALRHNLLFIFLRVTSTSLLVPLLEELFWRGWLMRFLIRRDFLKVPLGTYDISAFWLVAILFASEHGPYWDVGLAAGLIYNWWIVRTRNLADCFLAHGVTNALLALYVLAADQWQYWL